MSLPGPPKPFQIAHSSTQGLCFRGGVLNKCLYGEAPTSNPLRFIYHFSRKRYPFRIRPIDKLMVPLSQTLFRSLHPQQEVCIPIPCITGSSPLNSCLPGVLLGYLGGDVPPSSQNLDPDFRPKNAIIHTRFQT